MSDLTTPTHGLRGSEATTQSSVSALLRQWSKGDEEALFELVPLIVNDLRHMARGAMAGERRGHTLQATALVNEVFLRFAEQRKIDMENRAQFFTFAAQMMRRILVDHHRSRTAHKRGAGAPHTTLDEALGLALDQDPDLIALDLALADLRRFDPESCRVVEMRYFIGLTYDEIAEILDVPKIRVRRQWDIARRWLASQLRKT